MSTAALHRAVRLTARGSATLFAAAEATLALRPGAERTTRRLYVGFLLAHAVHFVAVAKYAIRTKGRNLFPGGRSLDTVGGWPAVAVIYTAFAGVALTGWPAHPDSPGGRRLRLASGVARVLIGTLFVGTYLGQLRQSRWYAVPAAMVGAAVIAGPLVGEVRGQPGPFAEQRHGRRQAVDYRRPNRLARTVGQHERRRKPCGREKFPSDPSMWGERLMTALRDVQTVDVKTHARRPKDPRRRR